MYNHTKIIHEVERNPVLASAILLLTVTLGYGALDYLITHATAGNRQIFGTIFMILAIAWIAMIAMATIYTYRSLSTLRKTRR